MVPAGAYRHGAVVIYGRCDDEDLGALSAAFTKPRGSLVHQPGADRLWGCGSLGCSVRSWLADVVPDIAARRADLDTERYALFDAVAAAGNGFCERVTRR